MDSGLFWRNPFLNWDLVVLRHTDMARFCTSPGISFNNRWNHSKFNIPLGKWCLEDHYLLWGNGNFSGAMLNFGGVASFWMNCTKLTCFSSCPVLWALSHNLPPLVVVVRAPLLQFEVPQIYAVQGWHIQTSSQRDGTKAITPKIWRILLHFSLMPSLNAELKWTTSIYIYIYIYLFIHPYSKVLQRYTLPLGKAQTMSCIWA